MTRRDIIIKLLAYGFTLAVITVINYYVLAPLPMALPLLLPLAAVAVGSVEHPGFAAGFGLAAGLVLACASHISLACGPILAAAGWLSGLMAQYVLHRSPVSHLVCSLALMLLWELWEVGSRLLHHVALLPPLLQVAIPELLWTLLFTFPVYWLCRWCCVRFGRIRHE